MLAVVLTRHGGPEALDVRRDWPVPVPGPGQVRVRVRAAAVNNTDVWTREGAYGLPGQPNALAGWRWPLQFPRIQGGDILGIVEALGADVPAELAEQRVLVDPAIYRDESSSAPPVGLLGSEADGGFAEYVLADADRVHDVTGVPLGDEQLACLPIAYGTAMGMLERAELTAGETVLVTGASGGVGSALVQLAAARGARVLALTSSEKADEVRQLGADVVLVRESGRLLTDVDDAAPDGLHLVADVAGGSLVEQLLPRLRDDGRWVVAGAVAGARIDLDLRRLYLHNRRLIGSSMHTRAHFAALVDLTRSGAISPRVAASYPLAEISAAQRRFRESRHVGKIVLVP